MDIEHAFFLFHLCQKLIGRHGIKAMIFPLFIHRRAHKVGDAHARDFNRVLKTQEDAFTGTVFHRHFEKVFSVENNFTFFNFKDIATGNYRCQGAFAGSVRAHYGMHFSGSYFKIDSFQDFLTFDGNPQVFNTKHNVVYYFKFSESILQS